MNLSTIEQAIIDVLTEGQRDSGDTQSVIGPSTCPLEDLPGFDSTVAPAVTSDLARKLDISIPYETNIFVDTSGTRRLTVGEIARGVQTIATVAA